MGYNELVPQVVVCSFGKSPRKKCDDDDLTYEGFDTIVQETAMQPSIAGKVWVNSSNHGKYPGLIMINNG